MARKSSGFRKVKLNDRGLVGYPDRVKAFCLGCPKAPAKGEDCTDNLCPLYGLQTYHKDTPDYGWLVMDKYNTGRRDRVELVGKDGETVNTLLREAYEGEDSED